MAPNHPAPLTAPATPPDHLTRHPAYRAGLEWLYGLSPNVRTAAEIVADHPRKLPRMRALLDRLDRPDRAFASVLVAGTKGKGSTAAMLDSILRAAGRATGLYTQPHLLTWRERTKLGGYPIELDEAADLFPIVRHAVEATERERPDLGSLTTFEAGTALTFLAFANHGVELAVVEVGVGGAHDSTNVLDPLVSAIASISHDHTATLGTTLEAIAREKAGILRAGRPAVVGPQPAAALAVIEELVAALDVPLERVGREWRWCSTDDEPATGRFTVTGPGVRLDDLATPLVGRHQRDNATLAVAAAWALLGVPPPNPPPSRGRASALPTRPALPFPLACRDDASHGVGKGPGDGDTLDRAIRAGLAAVEWPGRFQILQERPWLVVDGAHNDESARRLAEAYRDVFGGRACHLVFGTSAGKDWGGMLDALLPLASSVTLTRSRHDRAIALAEAARALDGRGIPTTVEPSVAGAVRRALASAGPGDVVLVTGSLFVVGEAIEAAG